MSTISRLIKIAADIAELEGELQPDNPTRLLLEAAHKLFNAIIWHERANREKATDCLATAREQLKTIRP